MQLIFADVLNTLLEHDLDDLAANGQAEEEGEVESDDDDEEQEDVPVTDGKDDQEEEDNENEENGVELPSMSIFPIGCSSTHRASTFSTISTLSTASKDSMFSTLSVTSESYAPSLFSVTSGADSDFEDYDDYTCSPPIAEKCSPKSANKTSARLSQHFYRLFIKPKSPRSLSRAKSLGNPESKDHLMVREKRSNSLPQQVKLHSPEPLLQPQSQTLSHVCFRRRPILSSDEDSKNTTLRVVVFGADHVAGKVARAYNNLRRKESACPCLSRAFKLQFYFVPVKRDSAAGLGSLRSACPVVQTGILKGAPLSNVSVRISQPNFIHSTQIFTKLSKSQVRYRVKKARFCKSQKACVRQFSTVWLKLLLLLKQDLHITGTGGSTNDIAHLLGMLDPWYERNTLSLLNLPANVVCQVQLG